MIINYDEIKNMIKNNLIETMEDNYNFYQEYNVEVEVEQQFIKKGKINPNTIYIVIRFGKAAVSFGQTVVPITMTAISEENKLNVCQRLFMDFSHKYNLKRNDDSTIQQIYESPEVSTNFNYVFAGIRSTFVISGLLIISKNANFFTYYYLKDGALQTKIQNIEGNFVDSSDYLMIDVDIVDEKKFLNAIGNKKGSYEFTFDRRFDFERGERNDLYRINIATHQSFTDKKEFEQYYGLKLEIYDEMNGGDSIGSFKIDVEDLEEEIPTLQQTFDGTTQLDTQALYNTYNFTTSVAKIGTLALNFSTYLLDNIQIVNDVLGVYFQDLTNYPDGIETRFKIKISMKNGVSIIRDFRVVSCGASQTIGDIPTINMAFTQ